MKLPSIANSSLILSQNSFLILMGMVVLGLIMDNLPLLISCPVMYIITRAYHPTTSEDGTKLLQLLTLFTTTIGMSAAGPLFSFLIVVYENGEEDLIFYDWISALMFFYRETTHAGVTNTFGINSESSPILQNINILLEAISPMFTGLRDNIEKFLNASPDSPLIPQLRAERIRANELAPVIEVDMGIPAVDADFALNFERQSVSKRRWLTLAILVIMCLILSTVSIATPFTVGIVFYYLWTQKNHVYMSDTTTHMTFPDGVYNINWKILGATTKVGIAVVYRGVMHVPYHVSGNSPMEIEGRECQVTYCSPERDLTTYGGLPMFENIQDGEDVYINLENNNRRTKKTTALVTDNGIAFRHYTTPGESGSPVWTKTPEGDLKLVGQAGRWIGCGGEKAEFIVRDTSELETPPCPTPQITSEFEKGIKKIITHPGSGKTRTVISRTPATW